MKLTSNQLAEQKRKDLLQLESDKAGLIDSLASLKKSIADIMTKSDEDEEDETEKEMYAMMDRFAGHFYSYLDSLQSQIYKLQDSMYKHRYEGHLPELNGVAIKNLLDTAGVGDQYEVQKKIIYANDKSNLSATIHR